MKKRTRGVAAIGKDIVDGLAHLVGAVLDLVANVADAEGLGIGRGVGVRVRNRSGDREGGEKNGNEGVGEHFVG